jgi:hypothetical protein
MWRAKRWPLLFSFGAALVSTGVMAAVAASAGFGGSDLMAAFSVAAAVAFGVVCVSSSVWLARALWAENRPRWHAIAYGLGLVGVAVALPALALGLLGVAFAALGSLASIVLLALALWPILKELPPIPELLPLVAALELEATNEGWVGQDLFVGRRGQLTLDMPFSEPIPGLFAIKRGQGATATRPLLGDAVLDSTLELALPQPLQHLTQDPSLLLEAVHGAEAEVSEHGISLNRQLDKAALRANPSAAREQVLAEIRAIRKLFDVLQSGV